MTLSRLRLSVADALELAEGALRGIGYHNDEVRIIADHVIDAAMGGYAGTQSSDASSQDRFRRAR